MKIKNSAKAICNTLTVITLIGILLISCKKNENAPPEPESGFVTDHDGNTYKTIKIGNQCWMTENLKVKTYRNGDPIHQAQTTEKWLAQGAAYCVLENNSSAPGLLYNWHAVADSRNIAPAGWHIPTDEEWKELEIHLGMSQTDVNKVNFRGTNEGEKLMIAAALSGWTKHGNVWGTNESGFTALAGGCRLPNGVWGQPNLFSTGFWWSSSVNKDNDQAWYRHLDYKKANVFRFYGSKNYGMSIRCIKDEVKP